MKVGNAALNLLLASNLNWYADWAWALPLIVFTALVHVFGLMLIYERVERIQQDLVEPRRHTVLFVVIVGTTVLLATLLHAIEGAIWAAAYRLVGALPDFSSAVLYSLSAMTSYGHENLALERHWQVTGALEALNGMMLFGLTTAFLVSIIQKVWRLQAGDRAECTIRCICRAVTAELSKTAGMQDYPATHLRQSTRGKSILKGRRAKRRRFSVKGKKKGTFIDGLPDMPEFLV